MPSTDGDSSATRTSIGSSPSSLGHPLARPVRHGLFDDRGQHCLGKRRSDDTG